MVAKTPYPIENEHDFKGWRLMRPNAAKLLKEIVFRWRGSSIRVPGKPGKWTVYPIATWCDWTGLSRDQVERALTCLVVDGLILRERHRFEGIRTRAFIQPTELALMYLGKPEEKSAAQAALAATSKGTSGGTYAGTGAGSDYTSLPYPSTTTTAPTKAPSPLHGEGKGKAHTKEKSSKKLANAIMVNKAEPNAADLAGGEAKQLAKLKAIKQNTKLDKEAKRAALLELLPPIPGAAAVGVTHPSELHKQKWHGWSPELHLKRYDKYCEYAENALNKEAGKKGGFKLVPSGNPNLKFKLLPEMDPQYDAEMAELDAQLADAMGKLDLLD